MVIHNTATAAEFAGSWIRDASPAAARRHIGFCLESQRRCLAYAVSKGRTIDSGNTRDAIAVLELALSQLASPEGN